MVSYLETPTLNFMDIPVGSFTRNLSKKDIHRVFDETKKLLEQLIIDLEEQK